MEWLKSWCHKPTLSWGIEPGRNSWARGEGVLGGSMLLTSGLFFYKYPVQKSYYARGCLLSQQGLIFGNVETEATWSLASDVTEGVPKQGRGQEGFRRRGLWTSIWVPKMCKPRFAIYSLHYLDFSLSSAALFWNIEQVSPLYASVSTYVK